MSCPLFGLPTVLSSFQFWLFCTVCTSCRPEEIPKNLDSLEFVDFNFYLFQNAFLVKLHSGCCPLGTNILYDLTLVQVTNSWIGTLREAVFLNFKLENSEKKVTFAKFCHIWNWPVRIKIGYRKTVRMFLTNSIFWVSIKRGHDELLSQFLRQEKTP